MEKFSAKIRTIFITLSEAVFKVSSVRVAMGKYIFTCPRPGHCKRANDFRCIGHSLPG